MSYLNVPRIHFSGRFQADPSTVDNNDNSWNPTITFTNDPPDPNLTNNSVYWNPNGTHNFKFLGCQVRGAANDQGPFSAPNADPIIGAAVATAGRYPAKLVDLDPDNQSVSQIWGMVISIIIADPTDVTKVLASVTGTMPPTGFGDLWNRAVSDPSNIGMPTMASSFHSILEKVAWVNASASPLLAALQGLSPNTLSICFNVDSYQPNSNQPNFGYGRVVGTIGPSLAGEAPRSTPRRLAPQNFNTPPPAPSIFSTCGAAGAVWDAKRSRLILDLGNCIPTQGNSTPNNPVVPNAGWPITASNWQLSAGTGCQPNNNARLKSGAPAAAGTAPTFVIPFALDTYLNFAGIVEVPVPAAQAAIVQSQPLALVQSGTAANLVQEDPQGRYVDVSLPFLRLNPGDAGQVTLWATQFGQPWSGAQLQVAVLPSASSPVNNTNLWASGSPEGVVNLASPNGPPPVEGTLSVTTGPAGTATINLTAGDPGTPRKYSNGYLGPDGQVYYVSGTAACPWPSWGQIFLFPTAPINVLVFSGYTAPAQPTWYQDVYPILGIYARIYPYMKSIIDLGDYDTVVANITGVKYVLNLPPTDPHHMPIVRDLSAAKLAMINLWIQNGMPKGAPASSVPPTT